MKSIFADAFYFVALVNRGDQHHHKVVAAAQKLRGKIVTTGWVLAEFADALAVTSSRRLVVPFIRQLSNDPKTLIVSTNEDLFLRGLSLYEERQDKRWTFTDCTSFIVMRDHNISEALTGDHHFEQAGFAAQFT